jgi:MIP family channel proteins
MNKLSRSCYIAEFIGTAALVFFAAGSVMVSVLLGGLPAPLISGIASGTIVMVMVWALFEVSGAHLNPALTLTLWLSGEFPANKVTGYVCAQLAGSASAAAALYLALGNVGNMGANLPNTALGIGPTSALLIEFILSFLMMLVIKASFGTESPLRQFAALPIGGIVGIEVMLMGPVAGAAMNPARAFGPTLFLGDWSAFWVYVIGPVAGLIAGAVAWNMIRSSKITPLKDEGSSL